MAFVLTGTGRDGCNFHVYSGEQYQGSGKDTAGGAGRKSVSVKHIADMVPEVLYDPRKDTDLMVNVSEPDAKNMKGGFRHDPYHQGTCRPPSIKERIWVPTQSHP